MSDIEYSSDGELARLVMLSNDNDDFYVIIEDRFKEYLYEEIFKQLFDRKFKFLGIGGKQNILQNYDEIKSCLANKMFLCIMDADFDRYIYQEDMLQEDNVLYLKTYNIENYLINKYAFKHFIKGKVGLTDSELDKYYKFDIWINDIIKESKELFLCYCFMKKNKPTEQSVSIPAARYFNDKDGVVKKDQISEFIQNIIDEFGESFYSFEVNKINEKYMSISDRKDYFDFICGKFLIHVLSYHVKRIKNVNININDLNWCLASRIDKNNFTDIIDKVSQINKL